jgi:hypothetical protein
MLKSKFVALFGGVVVVAAAAAVAASAAPDAVAPAVTKVRAWAKGAPTTATVKGQLRLEGEPMAFARVELHTAKGVYPAMTDANGAFEVRGVPAGEAKVSVHVADVPPAPPMPKETEEGEYPEAPAEPATVPAHYRSGATSGLSANLKVGEQWLHLNLTAR